MLITIDGPSGVGKGTVARAVSYKLGFSYLDSGAMYRALALYADLKNIKEDDDLKLKKLLIDIHIQFVTNDEGEDRVFLNTDDVTEDIRSNEISQLASKFAKVELVRNVLTEMQKRLVKNKNYITEGRDMGTYVFPDADYKFYLDADPVVRAERRSLQLTQTLGMKFNPQKILEEINQRDNLDKTRKICPLHPADDAIIIDTTNLSVIDVVENIRGYGMMGGIDIKMDGKPGKAGLATFKHCYDAGVNFKATGDALIIAPMFICEKKHIDEIIEKLRTGITNYSKSKKN